MNPSSRFCQRLAIYQSESNAMSEFAVIQTRFESVDPELIVETLTRQGGMAHADARRTARRSRGILGEHFSQTQAEAVCRALTENELGVCVVPSHALPELPEPRTIRWFELDKEMLRVPEGIRGETEPMLWSSIFVVSVGQIASVTKTVVREKRPMASRFDKQTTLFGDDGATRRTRGQLIDVVDIIGVDQERGIRYLRMPSTEIAYARIMGDGTKLNRFERFLVIVEFLVAHATDAIISPETRKILVRRESNARPVEGDGIERNLAESLQTYNRWLLCQAIRRERELDDSVETGE